MKPSNKTWSLTVRAKSLYLDTPQGSLRVRLAPAVEPVIAALPDGTDVECEGAFDGGATVLHLVVTRVRRILQDLRGRVMTLPDPVVASDPRLATARARIHLDAGRVVEATGDVAALLELGDDGALDLFERLPTEQQQALLDKLVDWQAPRDARWRALQWIPLARWSDANLAAAAEQALAGGGMFGTVRAETLVGELERRKKPTTTLAKQTQKLRHAQATEGDTFHRIATELPSPCVIGADHAGVFVRSGRTVVQYALDGAELRRWTNIDADRIVEGVALRIEHAEPAGIRLSDGKTLYTFAHRIEHHDGELVWGVHARDPVRRAMRSEIVHIATGWVIASLDTWIDEVTWNAQHIFVRGDTPQTLTRDGKLVADTVPPAAEHVVIGDRIVPAAHAPWRFGTWRTVDAGGWIVHARGHDIFLAPSEPGAAWVQLELAREPSLVDLAPPWLAVHGDGPIVLLALAEAASAAEIRIDGKRFCRHAKATATVELPRAIIDWYGVLVEAGVVPARPEVERDAHLFRTLGSQLPADALARVLAGHSAAYVEHADFFVEPDDPLFAQLTAALGSAGVREIDRATNDAMLTIEVLLDGKTLRRQCTPTIESVMVTIDAMLAKLGSPRRIFAIVSHDPNRRTYLAITPEQRRTLVAGGVAGIHAGARS